MAVWLVCALGVGCGGESADELFDKGEAATHQVATYSRAQTYLADFLKRYPDDPRADVALQGLARILQSRQMGPRAISRYEELIRRFPQSRYVDQAQFMIGYIHDQNGDYAQARTAYRKVIRLYPHSDLVDDAEISIANLGRSLETWLLPDSSATDTTQGD